jgi:hypothetical protein
MASWTPVSWKWTERHPAVVATRPRAAYLVPVRRALIPLLVLLAAGCPEPTSHRNPSRFASLPASKTLLTGAVKCGESHEVAAGGLLVRRATGFSVMAADRVDARVSREGESAPALSRDHCAELLSDNARHPSDWKSPRVPKILKELMHLSGADSALVPVVTSTFRCDRKGAVWPWGEPAYESDKGTTNCHEEELVLIAYLFAQDGIVLWKAVHRYELTEAPDLGKMVGVLIRHAPIGGAAPLRGG